jgi:ketosteroid isomerase-like protein
LFYQGGSGRDNGPVASREVELVRRFYEAFNEGEMVALVDAIRDTLHPDFESDMSRRVFNPAHYRGIDGAKRFLVDMEEIWSGARTELEEVLQDGDRVLVLNRFTARGAGSGAQVQRSSAHLWFFEDGLIRRFVLYPDRDEARSAFAESTG